MNITKLDIAEREIVTAVRLLFDGGDPLAVMCSPRRRGLSPQRFASIVASPRSCMTFTKIIRR